jgi:hypothetical protein
VGQAALKLSVQLMAVVVVVVVVLLLLMVVMMCNAVHHRGGLMKGYQSPVSALLRASVALAAASAPPLQWHLAASV